MEDFSLYYKHGGFAARLFFTPLCKKVVGGHLPRPVGSRINLNEIKATSDLCVPTGVTHCPVSDKKHLTAEDAWTN